MDRHGSSSRRAILEPLALGELQGMAAPRRVQGSYYDSATDIPSASHLSSLQTALSRTHEAALTRQRLLAAAAASLGHHSTVAGLAGSLAGGGGALKASGSSSRSSHARGADGSILAAGDAAGGLPVPPPARRAATPTSNSLNSNAAAASRGTKRSRFDSESSLSPASSVASSLDLSGSGINVNAKPTSSRAGSPANQTGNALGLAGTHNKSHAAGSARDAKGKGPETQSNLPAIPGLSAPIPTLPGFTKKKQKQASPSPAPRTSPEVSTSKLPPPHSSLPPRPAHLPPKPGTVPASGRAVSPPSNNASRTQNDVVSSAPRPVPPEVHVSSPPEDPPRINGHLEDTKSVNGTPKDSPSSTLTLEAKHQQPARKSLPPGVKPPKSAPLSPQPSSQQARKSLPASVLASSAQGTPSRAATPSNGVQLPASSQGLAVSPSPAGVDASKTNLPADGQKVEKDALSREEKRKRKEEKRKRKLAAAGLSSAAGTPHMSPSGSMIGKQLLNGSGLPPNKMRKLEGSPGAESAAGGLKLKLNGITVGRSGTPSDSGTFAQPPPPRKPVPGVADDFSLPTRRLVPDPPPFQLPTPYPMKQSEVDEDFDHAKPASQVPYTSFANWANEYFRSYGEDDLAVLAEKNDDVSCWIVPDLGAHYQDTWAAMDAAEINGGQAEWPGPSNSLALPNPKRSKSDGLANEDLPTEKVFLGPLAERIMAAFKGTERLPGMLGEVMDPQDHPMPSAGDVGDGDVPATPALQTPITFVAPENVGPGSIVEMDALDLESRLTRELAFLGVIPLPAPRPAPTTKKGEAAPPAQPDLSTVNWAGREDDEISSSLRACQRLLKQQVATNDARKALLLERVTQRMAYQEFETLRDGLEAVIEGAWNKRQRAAQRKAQKDKKEKDKKEKDKDKETAATLAQSIAALNQPQPLTASLVAALTKRRNLVDSFAHLFPEGGLLLPRKSIYEGLEVEGNVVHRAPETM